MSKSPKMTKPAKLCVGETLQTLAGLKAYVAAKLPPEICKDQDGPYLVAILSGEENSGSSPASYVEIIQYTENGVPLHSAEGLGEYVLQPYDPLVNLLLNTPVQASITGRDRPKWFHFAGVFEGVPYVWEDGKTSYTATRSVPAKSVRVLEGFSGV